MKFPMLAFLTTLFLLPNSFLWISDRDFQASNTPITTSWLFDSARNGDTSPNPGEGRRDRATPKS